jgi:hypothetical protein
MSGCFARGPYKGHFAQFGFHQPFEHYRKPAVYEPHIEHRLVVRYEYIALAGLDMFDSIDANRQKHQPEEGTGPELLFFVDKLCVTPVDETDCEQRREYRQNHQYRPCYQILV